MPFIGETLVELPSSEKDERERQPPLPPVVRDRRITNFGKAVIKWLSNWLGNNSLSLLIFGLFVFVWRKYFSFSWENVFLLLVCLIVLFLLAITTKIDKTEWLSFLAKISIFLLLVFSIWQGLVKPKWFGFQKVELTKGWTIIEPAVAGESKIYFLQREIPLAEIEYQLGETTATATLKPLSVIGSWEAVLENPTTKSLPLKLRIADLTTTSGEVWYKILPKVTPPKKEVAKRAVAQQSKWVADAEGILTVRLNPGEWTSAIFRLEPDQNSPWIRILSDHYRFMAEDRNRKLFFIQPGKGKDFIEVRPDKELSFPINSGVMFLRFKGGQEGAEVMLSVHRLAAGGMIRRDS